MSSEKGIAIALKQNCCEVENNRNTSDPILITGRKLKFPDIACSVGQNFPASILEKFRTVIKECELCPILYHENVRKHHMSQELCPKEGYIAQGILIFAQ